MTKEKTIKVFECDYCSEHFSTLENCIEHESYWCLNNNKIKWKWYFVEKYFRGGLGKYKFRTCIPEKEWEDHDLLEYIGEHTDGGESYGYRIETTRKRKDFKEFILPPYLRYRTLF